MCAGHPRAFVAADGSRAVCLLDIDDLDWLELSIQPWFDAAWWIKSDARVGSYHNV